MKTYFLHEKFAPFLPGARGAGLSDQDLHDIVLTAVEQSPFLASGSSVWMRSASIQKSFLFLAYGFGDQNRKYGGLLAITHPMRAGHGAFNHPSSKYFKTHALGAAFVGTHHDDLEDLIPERTPKSDAKVMAGLLTCWHGDKKSKSEIACDVSALTDRVGLKRWLRLDEQMQHVDQQGGSIIPYTPRATVVRFCEKMATVKADLETVIDAFTRPTTLTADNVSDLAKSAQGNYPLISRMSGPVRPEDKEEYKNMVIALTLLAERIAKHGFNPPRDARLTNAPELAKLAL